MSDKTRTGITGLDEILLGGIPRGNCVLLAGSAGTGKTVMSLQYLFTGAKEGENGLYLSLVEPVENILKNISEFQFFEKKYLDQENIIVVDLIKKLRIRGVEFDDIEGVIALIKECIEETQAKRVTIDSITALCQNMNDQTKIRDFILELGYQLKYLEVTSIMISEIPPQTFIYSKFGIEEFIADGVILLTDVRRTGDLLRSLQVVKMRGVNHSRVTHVMKIRGEGINLLPMFKADID